MAADKAVFLLVSALDGNVAVIADCDFCRRTRSDEYGMEIAVFGNQTVICRRVSNGNYRVVGSDL